jgi:fatty acid desaturase
MCRWIGKIGMFLLRVVVGRSLGEVLQRLGIITWVVAVMTGLTVAVWSWVWAQPGPVIFVLTLVSVCMVLNLFCAVVFVSDWVRHRAEGPWQNVEISQRSVRLTEEAAALFLGGRDDNDRRKFAAYVDCRPSRSRFYRADVIEATR